MLTQTQIVTAEWVARQNPQEWLAPPEWEIWRALPSPRRRADWLAGRLAAKCLLRAARGLSPRACVIGSDGVAPLVREAGTQGLNLSLSHSHGLGAASWADTEREGWVGLDAQRIRPVHGKLAARALSETEQAQLAAWEQSEDDLAGVLLFWTLKEAAIKARRQRWTRALRELEVTLDAAQAGTATVTVMGETTIAATYERFGNWWLARAVRPARG